MAEGRSTSERVIGIRPLSFGSSLSRVVGIAAILATALPCFLGTAPDDRGTGFYGGGSWSFSIAAMISGSAVGLALMAFAFVRRRHAWRDTPAARVLRAAGIGAYLLGAFLPLAIPSFVAQAVGGMAFGAGITCLLAIWMSVTWSMTFRQLLVGSSLATIVALLADQAVFVFPSLSSDALIAALCIVGVVFSARVTPGVAIDGRAPSDSISNGPFDQETSFVEAIKMTAPALLGLVFFAMYSNAIEDPFPFAGLSGSSFGLLVSSLLIVFMALLFRGRDLAPLLYWAVLPTFSLILIVLDSFPITSVPFLAGAIGITVYCSAMGLLAVSFLAQTSKQNRIDPLLAVGLMSVSFCFFAALGSCIQQSGLARDETGSLFLSLSTMYLVCTLIEPVVLFWKSKHQGDSSAFRKGSAAVASDRGISRMRERFSLSPRETEVLVYLAQGYNSPYIAKALFISDSTVRTHMKGIYRKVGVNSRMELLDALKADDSLCSQDDA